MMITKREGFVKAKTFGQTFGDKQLGGRVRSRGLGQGRQKTLPRSRAKHIEQLFQGEDAIAASDIQHSWSTAQLATDKMERFASFDGVEIAYQRWGHAGMLPPVILYHGFIVDANINWVLPGVVTALTNAGLEVVALDARGHGISDKPHDPRFYGEEKMVQDLRRLFDIVGAYRVDLVGYSMGATVSLITAGQDPRIRRLVVGGIGAMVVELGGVDNHVRVVP
jgi:predicted alpha/beta-fold hydrolase